MFDKNKFKIQLLLNNRKLPEIAELLGVNLVTLYRKMNGESDFYRNEIQLLCEILNIENPAEIFFAEEVT